MRKDEINNDFTEFQKQEYNNISSAHFETNKQIAIFFRYFLLIASAPAIIVLFYDKNINKVYAIFQGQVSVYETVFVGAIIMIISILGFLTFLYITNLLSDSILYAKTVNGTRKYFYELFESDNKERYRVLPIVTCEPNKSSLKFLSFPILFCISLTNSIYFSLSTYIISLKGTEVFVNALGLKIFIHQYNIYWILYISIFLLALHYFVAKYITNYRDNSYLKSYKIGIDIDGVLNNHRKTFCNLYNEQTGKNLKEEEIIKVPVSLIPDKNITRRDEWLVFNQLKYWELQEAFDDKTADIVEELRYNFGFKIHIFSFRPWPDTKYLNDNEKYVTLLNWWQIKLFNKQINLQLLKLISKMNLYNRRLRYFKIRQLTKRWLKKVGIKYDKLLLETNGFDNPPARTLMRIPKIHFRNRFYYAKTDHFRYFVEDVPENAIKLSMSCDYVFLINQPYNTELLYPNLPKNIIRVKNWSAIKEKIRELG